MIHQILEEKYLQFNRPEFIANDPISIPHQFIKKQDIEIAGLFAALFAWGQRKTIIAKCIDLMSRMDNAPHDFVLNHQELDLKNLLGFKHRTFNDTDLLYFVFFLKQHYQKHESLETAFLTNAKPLETNLEAGLNGFRDYFMRLEEFPPRTAKHISSPNQKSACKRLNMFLRWMVRKDNLGVDFGIWNQIKPAQLYCPLDLHVSRVARELGLLTRKHDDWLAVVELTKNLSLFDPIDPVKYDFALFGMGISGNI